MLDSCFGYQNKLGPRRREQSRRPNFRVKTGQTYGTRYRVRTVVQVQLTGKAFSTQFAKTYRDTNGKHRKSESGESRYQKLYVRVMCNHRSTVTLKALSLADEAFQLRMLSRPLAKPNRGFSMVCAENTGSVKSNGIHGVTPVQIFPEVRLMRRGWNLRVSS